MNAVVFEDCQKFRLKQNSSWWDQETDCRLVLSQPSTDPELWSRYTEGAMRCYRAFGIERVIDHEAMATGDGTALFFVALDRNDRVVAGFRGVGPLRSADDSHAVVEWAGQPALPMVRAAIDERAPFGLLELKTAWISDTSGLGRRLSEVIVRGAIQMSALLDTKFLMATAATYLLEKWLTAGGVIAPIPAAPYPDERFETKMMLWDRETFISQTTLRQAAKLYRETTHVLHAYYRSVSEGCAAAV